MLYTIKHNLLVKVKDYYKHNTCIHVRKFKYAILYLLSCYSMHSPVTIAGKCLTIFKYADADELNISTCIYNCVYNTNPITHDL